MRLPGPLAGRTLGEFTVGELLGEGAHGVVHRAAQRGLDREVVIKVLRARATDERAAAFLREAQLAARLDHPYAAHVYASGVEPDGLAWIAMELVRGTTLADVLALQPRGRMPVARWVGLLDRICEVVHTAHEQGIVHRDLKPANIMVVARAGRLLPKLLDLGVAALVDERSEGAVGTPAYMAPEQGGGEDIDARADIYALGVMTWEALTGVRPFAGATLGELAQVRAIGPTWPADLPAELGAAVRAALGDRDARPATALAFAAAVRDAAGIRLAADALPRLDDGLRAELAWLPQPIAEAVGAIERARNPHQARDALWAIVDVAARWLGVLALAARRAVGPGPGGDADAPAVVALVRALHRRELADEEWLALARGLAGRFAAAREAYPIPELVDLALAEASPFAPLIALRAAELAATSEETLRAWLARTLPLVTALVRALAFLADYQLVVPRADGAELWIGARAARRAMMHVTGELALGEPALVDFDGRPVLALAPLVAIAAPAPGARDELFLFAGPGRGRGRGARLVAVPDGFERHDDDVWAWMRAHLLGGDALAARPTDEAAPYRGLAAFTAADADRFVGRERQADALLNRLLVTPLVAVVGPSGAGKSSFVQAGLVPRLPAGWRAVVLRPGHAPLAAFARVALDDAPLVIVVDQFEELFTLGADADERERFAAALVAASRRAQVRVVLTVRDDFLARAGALPALRDQLAQGIELVATPSADELVRILTEPARRAGYDFDDPELPTRMVRAVAAEPGALALLSFTAARLWELRDRAFHRLTRAAYEAIGGVEGALAAHAEAVLAAGTLEEQRLIRDAFRRLVTADGTRAVLARGELETVLGGERAAGVVERLIGARLLVAAEAEEGDAVEIIHEALIGAWPRLVQWRRDDAEGARLRDQLRTAAQQWHARDRARGLLWRDDALDDYRRWRARWPDPLPALDEEFASASLADAARGRRRRRALMASAATILVGATVALSLLYRASEENATVAQDRLVASYVESGRRWLIDGDYLRALPYLSAAYSAGDDTPALRFMLHRAMKLADTPVYRGAPEARAAGFRADGSVVAVHTDGSAEILDGATARVIAALPAAPAGEVDPDATGDVSADGALAAVPRKAAVVLWDGLASRSLPVSATRVAFDATGARLATASATELAVWDVATATRVWVLPLDGVVMDLAWSGDAVLARFRGGRALLARPVITPLENAKRIASAADGSIALLGGEGVALHAADGGVRSIQIPDAASVAFDETRGKLAVGTNNGVVQLYDRATGQFLGSCVGHVGPVRMVSFAPDGQILATIGSDRTLRVWDATWRRELARFVGLDGAPNSLRFDGGGHRMVVATTDGHVHTFPVVDPAAQLVVDAGEVLGATRFANGGARIFANTESGVALWDATTGQRVARLAIATGDGASLSPDGDLVALPLAGEPTLELRGSIDGPVRARLSLAAVGTATAFDHRGQRVVSAATNGAVDVWSVDGSHLASLRGHVGEVWTAAFSPDDRRVVTAGYSDRTARVWDAATGAQLAAVSVGDSMVSAAFDATGERVLTASEDRVARLWDARRAVQLQAFVHDTTISGAALRGDGALLVGGTGDGVVAVWDVPSGQIIGTFRHGRYVGSVDFAPDGRRLLSASGDHRAISWDVADDIPGRSETAAFVACHSPYRLRVTQLEIVTPDACK